MSQTDRGGAIFAVRPTPGAATPIPTVARRAARLRYLLGGHACRGPAAPSRGGLRAVRCWSLDCRELRCQLRRLWRAAGSRLALAARRPHRAASLRRRISGLWRGPRPAARLADLVERWLCPRGDGHARAGQRRASGRYAGSGRWWERSAFPGYMTRGTGDRGTYYYRRVFTDA